MKLLVLQLSHTECEFVIKEKVKIRMNNDDICLHGNNISMKQLLVRQLSQTECEFLIKKK